MKDAIIRHIINNPLESFHAIAKRFGITRYQVCCIYRDAVNAGKI